MEAEEYIEVAYQDYKKACFEEVKLSKTQDVELRKAFFGGSIWLSRKMLNESELTNDDEKMSKFLTSITKEIINFVETVKQEIN